MKKSSLFLYNIFAVTIFLGAFLLFQVQPLISKYILPWFGGTSFVWVTSLLFFQVLLLGGYLYSYLVTKLNLKQQFYIHVSIIALGITLILFSFKIWGSPLTPDLSWKLPDTFPPTLQILQMLTISVGFPYFILSITSTLLQKWFSNLAHKKTPYSLYSVSNAGSLLGIIAYPFLVEPMLPIKEQSSFWAILFIFYSILMMLIIFFIAKNIGNKKIYSKPLKSETPLAKLSRSTVFTWLALPAVSSILLLSSSDQLTQGIAPIPFLWLIPLGLYLLSFILCFDAKHKYNSQLYAWGFLIATIIVLALLYSGTLLGIIPEILIYSLLLFFSFMLCHGELHETRPDPSHLNLFYLLIALGSALGSGFVAILAPLVFKGLYWEFIIGLFLTSLIAALALLRNKDSFLSRLNFYSQKERYLFIMIVISAFFLIIALINFATQAYTSIGIWRNFYGILRITKIETSTGNLFCIIHGKIIHGCQYEHASLRNKPIMYFGDKSGIGLAMKSLQKNKKAGGQVRMGIIGLGAGNLAVYGQKGDYIKFYELNPLNVEVTQKHFSYIADSPAKIDLVVGDGRLSLEKELKEKKGGNFDILVMDAFNDDAIPPHLITKEAFALYKEHLASPQSIIAVNISTSYLNLKPLMMQLAKTFNMHLVIVEAHSDDKFTNDSRWALFAEDKKLLNTDEMKKAAVDLSDESPIPLWTDQYSNLFHLLQ